MRSRLSKITARTPRATPRTSSPGKVMKTTTTHGNLPTTWITLKNSSRTTGDLTEKTLLQLESLPPNAFGRSTLLPLLDVDADLFEAGGAVRDRHSAPLPSHISVLLFHLYSLHISRFIFRPFRPLSHASFAHNCLRRQTRAYQIRAHQVPHETSCATSYSTSYTTR